MTQIGLYIHIPFCIKKCNYCDFNSYELLQLIPPYLEALKQEIQSYGQKDTFTVRTVFIGGGTPTILDEKALCTLIECLHSNFKIIPNGEFTIEANPGTLSRAKLKALKDVGVNRLSIGLQAFQDRLLKILGRIHTVREFEENFFTAREVGFDNINVDTIFGLPQQTLEDHLETLQNLLKLSPEHISAYALSIEEGTPFHEDHEKGELLLPSEDEERLMYHDGIRLLTGKGYKHYEISNFSITGRESEHNMIYWNGESYLGLGAGAHSYLCNKRFCNHPSIQEYIKLLSKENSAITHRETIALKDEIAEYCFLGLRKIDGISKKAFKRRFNKDIKICYGETIANLNKRGLLQENSRNVKLTTKGLDFANDVFMEFLP